MQQVLHTGKAPAKKYRHFSVPSADVEVSSQKLEFFYIGKRSSVIDVLIKTFDSGYAADNLDEARAMLNRHHTSNTGSMVIFAECGLGHGSIIQFAQFIASHKQLSTVPFIIEGSALTPAELEKFRSQPVADDIISLNELGPARLMAKVKFWKKVKERIQKEREEVTEDLFDPTVSYSSIGKRIFDILISIVLMVALSPVFLLIMLALKIESKGPLFYISKRTGRGYRIFNFYKFRTMVAEASDKITDLSHLNMYNPLREDGPVFIKIDNDPRVTPLGNFLRRCSLDELPQLLNVLKGDMSLVGNRPLPLYEAVTLTTDEWTKRFMAPAGITGLWQIRKKRVSHMTAEERIMLDVKYADKASFTFDLWIMANTPSAAIQRTNA